MSSVTFENVTKRFGAVAAVDALQLEVKDHEFLVLLGPSGCGKSTALRMIAGLDEPSEGNIRIGDRVINNVDPKDRDIAMVFQSYALYPHMTVRKNIEFPLDARKTPAAERATLVNGAAESLGLTDYLDRKPAQLSGGQRQRVALARAIVRRPSVFLMDEPLSNLDAKLRVQTRVELVELQRKLTTTLIYVTHDQIEAMTMGDRIAIMRDGRLQQVGPPQDVYDHPANRFVAEFIGTPPMNTFAAHGVSGRLHIGSAVIQLHESLARVTPDGPVIAGVRPEHFEFVDAGISTANGLAATPVLVESLGHERHIHCRVDSGDVVIVRIAASAICPDVGTSTRLAVAPDSIHVFSGETGMSYGAA